MATAKIAEMHVRLTKEYVEVEKAALPEDRARWVDGGHEGDEDDFNEPESASPEIAAAADLASGATAPAAPPAAVYFPIGSIGIVKGLVPRTRRGQASRVYVQMQGFQAAESATGEEANGEQHGTLVTKVVKIRAGSLELVPNGKR